MTLTVTEAAEAAGVARSTLYRAIEAGEITRTPDKRIDVAELVRVYGELRHLPGEEGAAATTSGDTSPETAAAAAAASTRADEAAWLRSLVDRQQATIEQQARELREAEERAERREATWLKQLDALTTKPLPASATLQPEAPEPSRGIFRRLFG